jgi:hypothetical protein
MKAQRACLTVAAAIGVALMPSVANAAVKDSVSGHGSTASADIRVNAHGTNFDDNAGTFTLRIPAGRFQVKVTCFAAEGNRAVAGGLDETGVPRFVVIEDNGDTDDRADFFEGGAINFPPDHKECRQYLREPLEPVTGDFKVVDGSTAL